MFMTRSPVLCNCQGQNMTDIPVNPGMLRWAREFRGLSEADAASRLGIEIEELREFEAGNRQPSLTAFENFAAKYRLPQATLFRRTPPPTPAPPADFRTFGGQPPNDSFEFRVALSNVRTLLSQLERVIEDDEDFAPPNLPSYSRSGNAEDLGEQERRRLGVTVSDQLGWSNPAEAFRQWRRLVEGQGVSVFLQKFSVDDCRGFTIFEAAELPCIVINKSEDYEAARIFTLLHEYAHLLLRQPGISDQNDANPVEAFCNRFAAGFLMPRAALREVIGSWPNEPVMWEREVIQVWARRLKVSQSALALRLESLGLAPSGFYAGLAKGQPPKKKPKKPGGSYVAIRMSEIGVNYAGTVLSAFDRGAINKATAVEALGMSGEHFGKVRDAVSGRRQLVDANV
jgi:Zn-dependent peptidase ImmA (M78 family)